MSEVLCWCCENYIMIDETEYGICELKKKKLIAYDRVCEEFIMRKGLHTKKTIPDYCKNYR